MHHRHPERDFTSNPRRATLPANKQDAEFVLWTRDYCRSERLIERLVNDSERFTGFQQVNALRELSKASEQASRVDMDAIQRQRLAVWEQGVKNRAISLGAPAQLELQSASEALETYVAWLMGKYPQLHWDPVIRCIVREPHAPERSNEVIAGEWEPTLETLVLLCARLKADLHALDGDWSFYKLDDRFDGDTLESAIQLQQELEKASEVESIEPSRANLEKLRLRASYYSHHVEELARHFQLFDTDTDPYAPDANLEARVGVRMSDLLAVEDYYETQVEKLTGVSAPRKNTSFLIVVPDVESDSSVSLDSTQSTASAPPVVQHSPVNPSSEKLVSPNTQKTSESQSTQSKATKGFDDFNWELPVWDRTQVAIFLGVKSVDTITRWAKLGKIPSFKDPSGRLRFTAEDIRGWRESQKTATRNPDENPRWEEDFPFSG